MVEKKRVVRTSTSQTADRAEAQDEMRCANVSKDGRRCQQWRWAGKEVCYQHDKEARAEKKLKEGSRQSPGFTVAQLQELLAMAMGQVLFGKMPVGQAYALGYLAQQSLAAHGVRAKEQKLDVKHFWEMVDLGATFERAAELAKERKMEAKKRKQEELTTEGAEDTEEGSFVPQSPSTSLKARGTREEEETDETEEEAETELTAEGAENTEEGDEGEDPPTPRLRRAVPTTEPTGSRPRRAGAEEAG